MINSRWNTVFAIYEVQTYEITYGLAFQFIGVCSAKICTFEHQETCARMPVTALFVLVKKGNISLRVVWSQNKILHSNKEE